MITALFTSRWERWPRPAGHGRQVRSCARAISKSTSPSRDVVHGTAGCRPNNPGLMLNLGLQYNPWTSIARRRSLSARSRRSARIRAGVAAARLDAAPVGRAGRGHERWNASSRSTATLRYRGTGRRLCSAWNGMRRRDAVLYLAEWSLPARAPARSARVREAGAPRGGGLTTRPGISLRWRGRRTSGPRRAG